jgi:hypothetical protein
MNHWLLTNTKQWATILGPDAEHGNFEAMLGTISKDKNAPGFILMSEWHTATRFKTFEEAKQHCENRINQEDQE